MSFREITLEATGDGLSDVDRDILRSDPEIFATRQVVYATQDDVHVVLLSKRAAILDELKAERERIQ